MERTLDRYRRLRSRDEAAREALRETWSTPMECGRSSGARPTGAKPAKHGRRRNGNGGSVKAVELVQVDQRIERLYCISLRRPRAGELAPATPSLPRPRPASLPRPRRSSPRCSQSWRPRSKAGSQRSSRGSIGSRRCAPKSAASARSFSAHAEHIEARRGLFPCLQARVPKARPGFDAARSGFPFPAIPPRSAPSPAPGALEAAREAAHRTTDGVQ